MSQGITSLRENLHKLFGDTPTDEENAKKFLREDLAGAFARAELKIEKSTVDKLQSTFSESPEDFEQFFNDLRDIYRYEELTPERQRDLLKHLSLFFQNFLFHEDLQDEDGPIY